jgi:hypothetical protein
MASRRLVDGLLVAVARRVQRWADRILAERDDAPPGAPPVSRGIEDRGAPDAQDGDGPPAHWLEMVRARAPHLLSMSEWPSWEGAEERAPWPAGPSAERAETPWRERAEAPWRAELSPRFDAPPRSDAPASGWRDPGPALPRETRGGPDPERVRDPDVRPSDSPTRWRWRTEDAGEPSRSPGRREAAPALDAEVVPPAPEGPPARPPRAASASPRSEDRDARGAPAVRAPRRAVAPDAREAAASPRSEDRDARAAVASFRSEDRDADAAAASFRSEDRDAYAAAASFRSEERAARGAATPASPGRAAAPAAVGARRAGVTSPATPPVAPAGAAPHMARPPAATPADAAPRPEAPRRALDRARDVPPQPRPEPAPPPPAAWWPHVADEPRGSGALDLARRSASPASPALWPRLPDEDESWCSDATWPPLPGDDPADADEPVGGDDRGRSERLLGEQQGARWSERLF